MVDVVGPVGVEVPERDVRQRRQVDDGVEAPQVVRGDVADILIYRGRRVVVLAEDAVAEECRIEAHDVVALRVEVAGHDRADIALVAGDENAHQIASTSLWIGRVDCVVSRCW